MSDRLAILQQVPLFASLSAEQIASLADRLHASTFVQNAPIFPEDDPADRMNWS
jgi:signal-transduction protein with cAMP-binding, CBS, and nucleotidyltransferase domain